MLAHRVRSAERRAPERPGSAQAWVKEVYNTIRDLNASVGLKTMYRPGLKTIHFRLPVLSLISHMLASLRSNSHSVGRYCVYVPGSRRVSLGQVCPSGGRGSSVTEKGGVGH
jgi:hypothetical protein